MVEIAISVAAKVVEFLVGPIARPFSYIWNYKTNFDNLKTEARKLEGQKETVQNSVDLARRNGDQIKQRVSDWLACAEKITDEASEVIEENQRANMKCFKGLCPNPKGHYQHSRKAVKKAKAIAELYADGNFQTVSIRTNPEDIWIPSYKGYTVFESRMSTLKDIQDALSNPDINMVGIYGTGGIGKTTIAKEIGKQAEDEKLFNVVAFAEVAVKPDIKYIQQEIAEKLGLTFRDENPSGRARHLQQRLKQEEKVLLVLDNIWERLNLEDVGIPFGDDHQGCKLLLTARNLDVLTKMDSQRNFKVGFLDEGEAWSLFEKKAGSCDHLQALAKSVAEACGGLPIAIDSVAVALKNKEEFEWKDALRKLTTPSSSNFEGLAAETYSSIVISYSQLKERELKSTFLLCCIMEYTLLEDLLSYGMGLGIFEDVKAIEDARNRVNTLVRKLKDSSLLLDINNNKISLHDVVRDVGRSIASRDGHMFTVTNNCILREWVDKDTLKNCVGISLYNISKLPEEFECPKLQFFYLRTTAQDYCRVPDNFFAGMPKLKVLHLARLELYSVPNSILLLANLRTLCIDDCKLRDIDIIGEFKQLEVLRIRDLYCYEIEMIPKKMCNLTGLRMLDLKDCKCLGNIPPNVLSTFTRLEELYLPAEIKWEVEGVNILDELKHLTHLTALKIRITDDSVLPKGRLVSNKLERYDIIIGNCNWYGFLGQTSRIVKLNLETISCSDDVQKFFSLLDREGFPELEHLYVENSPCFRTVVDCLESESCHHFLFLQSLSFHSVLNLEMIHNYPLKADSFHQLRTIKVQYCHKLKNILSFSTYRALPLLQKVNVFYCDNMEEIFAINRREEDINNDEGTEQIEFKHLSSLTLKDLPKLTSFCSINSSKDTPTPLFNQKVTFPSIEEIKISESNNLKILWHKGAKESFCNLKSMKVSDCNELLTIFQFNTLEGLSMPKLLTVTISNCASVEEIFDLQKVNFEESLSRPVTNQLQKLYLDGLPKLKHIWKKDPQAKLSFEELPMPESLTVNHCNSIEEIFDLQKVNFEESHSRRVTNRLKELYISGLPKLKHIWKKDPQAGLSFEELPMPKLLTVRCCYSIEEIFDLQKVNFEESHSKPVMNQLKELYLDGLPKLKHIWKKDPEAKLSFEELPMLESLRVSKCDSIEEIFDLQKVNFEESHSRPVTNRFKKLYISGLPKLKHIWKKDPQAGLSFEELPMPKSLTVRCCYSIEEIFDLQKVNFEESHSRPVPCRLQELNLDGLPKLKHIWNKDPQAELFFENLQGVYVSDCQNLKDLFPASIARSLLQLVELDVENCKEVEEIVAKEGEAKEAARFVFPKVTSIKLNRLPELRTFYRGVHSSKWEVLKELEVVGCDKLELLASQLSYFQENNIEESYVDISVQSPFFLVEKDSFPNLEKLILHGKAIKMIYSYEEDETHVGVDSKLDMVLSKLEKLTVGDCQNLIQLVPSSISFQNLTVLKVWGCHGLKNLMTSSTAKRLVQLREMAIEYCKSMIEVVAKGGDVTEDKIIFSKLRTLTLGHLSSLSCFCSENYTFELPSLEEIIVYRCPEMKYFSLGDITTPILQKVERDSMMNTTIQKTHN